MEIARLKAGSQPCVKCVEHEIEIARLKLEKEQVARKRERFREQWTEQQQEATPSLETQRPNAGAGDTREQTRSTEPRVEKQTPDKTEEDKTEEDKTEEDKTEGKQRRPGHGRRPADSYQAEETVLCNHESLRPGESCPRPGCPGRLYDTRQPCVHIRMLGRPVVGAIRYEQQVLRCSACQERFVARLLPGVEPVKYDPTADSMIALMKYGSGMPLYRMERMQELMGVPLPASTQFERCEAVAEAAHPVYLELERRASEGEVIHADDTGVKILACMKENQALPESERKGLHTTGIGSQAGQRRIALYASGRRHAGENLAELIRKRPLQLPKPIVMADAEAKNWATDFEQVAAKCLQHGRRRFKEVEAEFPVECTRVLGALGKVYGFEGETRGMTAGERLEYHQANSKPILTELREWIESQFDKREVEPNSRLGAAMRYMLKHWEGLTRFVEVEGAPLDNNLVERMLKRAVLLRKNALFYKTSYGARVGDILMSLIETCALNQVNPFDYLVALMRNAPQARAEPGNWLPWNYRENYREGRVRAA